MGLDTTASVQVPRDTCGGKILQDNIAKLKKIGYINKESSLYKSSSWGYKSENIFFNQALKISTNFSSHQLLAVTQSIEFLFGRVYTNSYQDRLIDIDIIFFNSEIINNEKLKIPHERMHERAFVLVPLCDIIPDFIHPVFQKSILSLSKEINNNNIFKHVV